MKAVVLTSGDLTLVDDEDFERVSRHHWYLNVKRNSPYAISQINGEAVGLHRFILGLQKGDKRQGDHINGDGLNNCRSNLRIASASDNQRNQARRIPKHGYRGIQPCGRSWRADIHVSGIGRYLGCFPTKELAALAYDKAAREVYGAFALPNFPARDLAEAVS